MVDKRDTMPGAVPTRVSDDHPVEVDLRTYVATGAEVTSEDSATQVIAPPPQVTLPVRASADAATVSQETVAGPTPDLIQDHPVILSVIRLCQLLDGERSGERSSESMLLRSDIRTLTELAQLAEQRLAESQASALPKRKSKAVKPATRTSQGKNKPKVSAKAGAKSRKKAGTKRSKPAK